MGKRKTLFTDIGNVIMTNGWDRHMRKEAVDAFHLEPEDFNKRHKEFYDSFEQGKINLDTYLDKLVFYKDRSFSKEEFKKFMFSKSKPFPEMFALYKELKKRFGFQIVAVSNEGKEIAEYRIESANLGSFIDCFVFSSFVGYQKPNKQIFEIALDISDADKNKSIFIDDREEHVIAAKEWGVPVIHHISYENSKNSIINFFNH